MIRLFKKYVYNGISRDYKDDTNRRIIVVNLFAAVGMTITFLLGMRALIYEEFSLALLLLVASSSFAASHGLQVTFKTAGARKLSVTLLLCSLMLLTLMLLVTGGKDNTGPLWIYLVPPVTMFFAGFVRGLIALLAFTLLCIILLFVVNDIILLSDYPFTFKTRLLYSFLTVSFLSAFYEYSRQKSYETALYLSDQFERQAKHDYLTQLLNRRGAQQCLERELARLQRNKGAFSLAIADIDHFKSINDTLGHEQGDEVLKQISDVFSSRLRKQDVLARWGGEEFMFIFPDTNEENAVTALRQIKNKLNETPLQIKGKKLKVTSSFGVCEVNEKTDVSYAITRADSALYNAKVTGRNKIRTSSSLL